VSESVASGNWLPSAALYPTHFLWYL